MKRAVRNKYRLNERGLTLVELLAAVTIGVIVLSVAVSIVYTLYSMFHRSSNDFVQKSETNLIVNAIVSGSSNATVAEVSTGVFIFKDDPTWHRFTVSAISGSSLKQLTYEKIVGSQINAIVLTKNLVSLKWSGMELWSISGVTTILGTDTANSQIPIEIKLQNGGQTETVTLNVKLLRVSKPTLPP